VHGVVLESIHADGLGERPTLKPSGIDGGDQAGRP